MVDKKMKKEYTLEQDGFRGIWFEGKENKEKAVIYMHGAAVGEKMTLDASKYVRSDTCGALCL